MPLFMLCVLAGCNRSPQATYPVKGMVKWSDGAAATEIKNATVELQVIEGPKIRVSPHGAVREDGTFVLRTYQPEDGAPAGEYRAIVCPERWDYFKPPPPPVLDSRFGSYTTSPLKVTIKPEPNEIVLTLDRARKR
jgi:hypothetical protein